MTMEVVIGALVVVGIAMLLLPHKLKRHASPEYIEPPEYCSECGGRLYYEVVHTGYDTKTGEPMLRKDRACWNIHWGGSGGRGLNCDIT